MEQRIHGVRKRVDGIPQTKWIWDLILLDLPASSFLASFFDKSFSVKFVIIGLTVPSPASYLAHINGAFKSWGLWTNLCWLECLGMKLIS